MFRFITYCGVIAGTVATVNHEFRDKCIAAVEKAFDRVQHEIEFYNEEGDTAFLVKKVNYLNVEVLSKRFGKSKSANRTVPTGVPTQKKPLSGKHANFSELELLAQMLYTETTDSNSVTELYLIGSTAINRWRDNPDKYPALIYALNAKKAYSGFNNDKCVNWHKTPTDVHFRIAKDLLENGVPSKELNGIPYSRIFAFCNRPLIGKWAEEGLIKQSVVDWFDSQKFAGATSNGHYFYYL